jgi:hypothetical protein
MSEFRFDDGSPHNRSARWDTRTGKLGGWTRGDFVDTINVHQRAFGPSRTRKVLHTIFGTTDPTRIPDFAYGAIISALAEEMACGQPHNITRSPLYAGKQ